MQWLCEDFWHKYEYIFLCRILSGEAVPHLPPLNTHLSTVRVGVSVLEQGPEASGHAWTKWIFTPPLTRTRVENPVFRSGASVSGEISELVWA